MTLRFRLLGEPQIWYGDVRLDKLLSRKALALLVYLVCHDQAIRREWLATLLWGECKQSRAFFYLRKALWEIGKVMAAIGLDRRRFLTVDIHEVQFAWDAPYSLDLQTFTQAIYEEDYERAAELYGSFLGTFTVRNAPEFEEWQRMQCAIFDVAFERVGEATMTATKEGVMLVKLALGAMAKDKGDQYAADYFTRVLNYVAATPCREFDIAKVKLMRDQLAERRGIGEISAIQLLAQLGWFVSQTIDNAIPPVVYWDRRRRWLGEAQYR